MLKGSILLFESVLRFQRKIVFWGIWFGSFYQYLCGDFPSDFSLFFEHFVFSTLELHLPSQSIGSLCGRKKLFVVVV